MFITLIFFFNHTAPTDIYTLSLHDALPISDLALELEVGAAAAGRGKRDPDLHEELVGLERDELLVEIRDRKSTRLNSSHITISYAVFCLKKKKNKIKL